MAGVPRKVVEKANRLCNPCCSGFADEGFRLSTTPPGPDTLHHHSRRMGGRDRHEAHRVATPLELLFDLTFVVSFGLAASQFAHALAEGHYAVALLGFGFASFGICWAWTNFSWFASAYDIDDWVFRIV